MVKSYASERNISLYKSCFEVVIPTVELQAKIQMQLTTF
jgi:hypothetical protein